MKIREIQCKSILSKTRLSGCDYTLNPYIGCAHGCVWCYSHFIERWRAGREKRPVRPWGSFVDVKINAPEVLVKNVRRLKGKSAIFLSTICDPYQPAEAKYKITRRCLEILAPLGLPISILTQSALVTRDIDLFKKFKDLNVGMSFITMDPKATRLFQPFTASPQKRVATLKKLHKVGIKTYIHVGPILPHFTDFEAIFSATHRYLNAAVAETLNTRGKNWTNLIRVLSRHYPNLVPEFRRSQFKKTTYLSQIGLDFEKTAKKYKIPIIGVYRHA